MLYFPSIPDVPGEQRTKGHGYLRYEEICQDGRVQVLGLAHTVGLVVWRQLLNNHAVTRMSRSDAIIPILSRLILSTTSETVSVGHPLTALGGFDLAHTKDDAGAVNRLLLNIWVELSGPRSRTHAPPPPGHGTIVPMGRVWAEHVFTKPFGPIAERKVLRLPDPDVPDLPAHEVSWRTPAEMMALPADATPLDEELRADPTLVAFGLVHTDSNQHVNSLVYPRLFADAVVRRLAELGRPIAVLPNYVEIAYRKPCFAGDQARIAMQVFELAGGGYGAIGCFIPAADAGTPASARPYCYVRMTVAE